MGLIPKFVKELDAYRFIRFLYFQYLQYGKGLYLPEEFALFGEGATVDPGVHITAPEKVVLHDFSVIHRGAYINSEGGLSVGRYSGIGYNCCIFTIDHKIFKVRSIPFDSDTLLKPVYIEDFVMMGANVSITPGTRIGEGAIIGMGSVLTKDVPPLAIVMGNPAAVVAYRDRSVFEELKSAALFQPQSGVQYTHSIPLQYRRKYAEFLAQIGMEPGEE